MSGSTARLHLAPGQTFIVVFGHSDTLSDFFFTKVDLLKMIMLIVVFVMMNGLFCLVTLKRAPSAQRLPWVFVLLVVTVLSVSH